MSKRNKNRVKLVRSWYSCTHENYDPGGTEEETIATFDNQELAEAYLEEFGEKLKEGWGNSCSFSIDPCEKIPHNPKKLVRS